LFDVFEAPRTQAGVLSPAQPIKKAAAIMNEKALMFP
jgi:hypothetical protein